MYTLNVFQYCQFYLNKSEKIKIINSKKWGERKKNWAELDAGIYGILEYFEHNIDINEYWMIQFSSVTQSCPSLTTPWTTAQQACLSISSSWSLLKVMTIKSVMPSNHLILCRPLLLLPSIFPSIRVFSNESVLHIRWPKYWSFNFNISSSNEYSRLISFRIDWFDLLAVQGTLKSLPTPQFKSIEWMNKW